MLKKIASSFLFCTLVCSNASAIGQGIDKLQLCSIGNNIIYFSAIGQGVGRFQLCDIGNNVIYLLDTATGKIAYKNSLDTWVSMQNYIETTYSSDSIGRFQIGKIGDTIYLLDTATGKIAYKNSLDTWVSMQNYIESR